MSFLATQRSAATLAALLLFRHPAVAETVAVPASSSAPANGGVAPAGVTPANTTVSPTNPAATTAAPPVPASPTPASAEQPPTPSPSPGASPPAPMSTSRPPAPASAQVVLRQPSRAAPSEAQVHLAANYEGAWLEGRSRIDEEGWRRLCAAPCDRLVQVDGVDMRVTAPRMTSSNVFVIEPGAGTARLRVSGGSARARDVGLVGLAAGLPVTFAGVTLFGVGSIRDQPGERTAGIVTLSIGAAAVLAALPLLVIGSTSVKNAAGHNVATAGFGRF